MRGNERSIKQQQKDFFIGQSLRQLLAKTGIEQTINHENDLREI